MAKPELYDHRKFLRLKRLLGEPTPHVIGYLECLWRRGYQTGDPVVGDASDVEAAAEFPGEPGRFTTAAQDAGFIDLDPATGHYSIHDLFEHAPRYVKLRMRRKGTDQDQCAPIAPPRPPKSDRARAQRAPTGAQCAPPPRTENREPRTKNPPNPPSGGEVAVVRPRDELFDAIAEVTGADPQAVGSRIGKTAADLRKAKPPYSPAEVREFGRRWWEWCTWAARDGRQRPTLNELVNHIGQLRAKPPPPKVRPPGSRPTTKGEAQGEFMGRVIANAMGGSDVGPENL